MRDRFEGTWWSTPTQVSDLSLKSVSCAATTMCLAVNDGGLGTAHQYDRARWTKTQVIDPDHGFDAVSCPTARFCMAVSTSNLYTVGR